MAQAVCVGLSLKGKGAIVEVEVALALMQLQLLVWAVQLNAAVLPFDIADLPRIILCTVQRNTTQLPIASGIVLDGVCVVGGIFTNDDVGVIEFDGVNVLLSP